MDTDQLIRSLAVDGARRAKPVWLALGVALLAAAPMSIWFFFWKLGLRPDVMTAMYNPLFDLKFAVTASLAASAIAASVHLSRPEASPGGVVWLLAIPIALLLAGIAYETTLSQLPPRMTRLIGSNSLICLTAVPVMSLPLLAASLMGLRHGAPSRPALTGAMAGLLSAGLAATLYASNCTDDSPLFVITWYSIATGAVAVTGALVGSRLLRY